MQEFFNRQRRNLVLMSVLVLFVNVTGAELSKINLLGNEVTLRNPDSLPFYLAIILGYFLIRYFQYMHDIEDKEFKTRFFRKTERNLEPYILRREYNNDASGLKDYYPNLKDLEYIKPLTMFNDAMPPNIAAASLCGKEGGSVFDINEIPVSNSELLIPFVKSALYIVFRTRLFTDYIFPIVMCILAFLSYSRNVQCWLQ